MYFLGHWFCVIIYTCCAVSRGRHALSHVWNRCLITGHRNVILGINRYDILHRISCSIKYSIGCLIVRIQSVFRSLVCDLLSVCFLDFFGQFDLSTNWICHAVHFLSFYRLFVFLRSMVLNRFFHLNYFIWYLTTNFCGFIRNHLI